MKKQEIKGTFTLAIVNRIIKISNLQCKDTVHSRTQEQHDLTEKDTDDASVFKENPKAHF